MFSLGVYSVTAVIAGPVVWGRSFCMCHKHVLMPTYVQGSKNVEKPGWLTSSASLFFCQLGWMQGPLFVQTSRIILHWGWSSLSHNLFTFFSFYVVHKPWFCFSHVVFHAILKVYEIMFTHKLIKTSFGKVRQRNLVHWCSVCDNTIGSRSSLETG